MTERQLLLLKELLMFEDGGVPSSGVEVLHDATDETKSFMKKLIEEGSVCAYQTRSDHSGMRCFLFTGFTPKGLELYRNFVRKLER